ncbi:hypothetical protein JOF41_007335 [Saccharothrix coeruleofusca]|uniref:hypothetical protein n=1 Tax=Saccharothrix coeruleofusca TaxID=33919 RepID=UPI001AE2E450|nr:hypothetical protein [Saccharothrix coeruleofusca]MBP2341081.1 hypothetical protein [Saccharothrix coeruleofusca]
MKFHAIIVTDPVAPEVPQLVDAWDAGMVAANPQGWRDTVAEESKGTAACVAVVVEVPDEVLLALLYPQPGEPVRGVVRPDTT